MIKWFPETKAFEVILGFKDVGVAETGSDDKDHYKGVGFVELTRPYEKGEVIPESEQEGFKVVLTVYNEAGYASLWGAVKRLGERLGYDKFTMGDKLFEGLMHECGERELQAKKAEYELKEALAKIAELEAKSVTP